MGMMLKPFCECGSEFQTEFVGGGFSNIKFYCNVPFICYHCKTVFSKNGVDGEKKNCPKCRRKTSPLGMISKTPPEEIPSIFDWEIDDDRVYYLEDKKYECPNCGEEELSFEMMGLWD